MWDEAALERFESMQEYTGHFSRQASCRTDGNGVSGAERSSLVLEQFLSPSRAQCRPL